nr:MAG: hypothetical protein AM325_13230 [Candidatus Thorarchaeota archaeon SMTZ1-45]
MKQYYASKMGRTYKTTDPRKTSWEKSGTSMIGWMSRFGSSLDMPFKSISLFVGSWMLLEIGWPILTILGIVTAGSVWSVPSSIASMFIVVYGLVLISGVNVVRSLIVQLTGQRDNLVKALFRGYFWSLLVVGLILTIHQYFHSHLPFLYLIPIIYLLPIEILGNTVPIPIPLGITGMYMDIIVMVLIYVVGITGSCIGGLEILKHFIDSSRQRGSYHAILSVLILAVFPAMNIHFSVVFLNSILDLYRGLILGA